ncbi:hypothetical protein ACJX0J_013363, partial [Zea mays]
MPLSEVKHFLIGLHHFLIYLHVQKQQDLQKNKIILVCFLHLNMFYRLATKIHIGRMSAKGREKNVRVIKNSFRKNIMKKEKMILWILEMKNYILQVNTENPVIPMDEVIISEWKTQGTGANIELLGASFVRHLLALALIRS